MSAGNEGKSSRTLVIIVSAILGFTALCLATVGVLWLSGRSSTGTQHAPGLSVGGSITPPPAEESAAPDATPAPTAEFEAGDSYTLTYDGQKYRYNDETVNILLMGVDEFDMYDDSRYGEAQADVIVLAVLDTKNKKLTFISVSRDAMCEFDTFGEDGEVSGMMRAQLGLSFTVGDGAKTSCENCAAAVSRLFGGLQIHGYGALYMNGIVPLNDAVGGVTLKVLEDLNYGYRAMKVGETVTLKGNMAQAYIRARLHTTEGNNLRMQRQKQYMLALFNQAKSSVKHDPTRVASIYSAASDYILTDLAINKLCYLAFEALDMEFSQDILNVPGKSVLEGQYAAYYVDTSGLFELMLDVFYEPVS